jgi:dUTP pyrophosphatase
MNLEVTRLHPLAVIPAYAHGNDAGADLVSVENVTIRHGGGRALVHTGWAFAIPDGFAGLVLPRSGTALRHGVTVINAPGLIDAGYRGEIMVALINTDPSVDFTVSVGDRIAQLVITSTPQWTFAENAQLAPSTRGEKGFGSTGR